MVDSTIETNTGRMVDVLQPDPATIVFDDVAYHLASTCRYAGAVRITVAEHAVLVARKLRAEGAPPELQLAGLHHDDAEAYLHDVSTQLKQALLPYEFLEERMHDAICAALGLAGLPWGTPALHAADRWALAAEAHHLHRSRGRGWKVEGLYDPDVAYGVEWDHDLGLAWADAENLFRAEHDRIAALIPAWSVHQAAEVAPYATPAPGGPERVRTVASQSAAGSAAGGAA